jgi:hypothetical protein
MVHVAVSKPSHTDLYFGPPSLVLISNVWLPHVAAHGKPFVSGHENNAYAPGKALDM